MTPIRSTIGIRIGICCAVVAVTALAQVSEPLIRWPYFREIRDTGTGAGLADVVLDVGMLDKSRRDHGDLRLYDAAGNEVPYALRIRRKVQTSDAFEASEFNKSAVGNVSEIWLDLGEQPAEHNQVEIDTAGANFRRRVAVDGSSDGVNWSNLVSRALIFRFSAAGGSADQQAVPYPPSRFSFLRVRVQADREVDGRAPVIRGLTVRRSRAGTASLGAVG